jgi:hypothetical protein
MRDVFSHEKKVCDVFIIRCEEEMKMLLQSARETQARIIPKSLQPLTGTLSFHQLLRIDLISLENFRSHQFVVRIEEGHVESLSKYLLPT